MDSTRTVPAPLNEGALAPTTDTARHLVEASISPNTRRAYRGALARLDAWLGGRPLTDPTLADYLATLHGTGRAPATASQVLAAARFRGRLQGRPRPDGPAVAAVLRGLKREGRDRGRGQVTGVRWEDADAAARIAADHRGAALPAGLEGRPGRGGAIAGRRRGRDRGNAGGRAVEVGGHAPPLRRRRTSRSRGGRPVSVRAQHGLKDVAGSHGCATQMSTLRGRTARRHCARNRLRRCRRTGGSISAMKRAVICSRIQRAVCRRGLMVRGRRITRPVSAVPGSPRPRPVGPQSE